MSGGIFSDQPTAELPLMHVGNCFNETTTFLLILSRLQYFLRLFTFS